MNCMEQVAKMLGVELGERFALESPYGRVGDFEFAEDGLYGICGEGRATEHNRIVEILTGDLSIVKKPWIPGEWQKYYSISILSDNTFKVEQSTWCGAASDYTGLACGNCFRTEDEAKAAIPWFAENVERIKWGEPWEAKRNEL